MHKRLSSIVLTTLVLLLNSRGYAQGQQPIEMNVDVAATVEATGIEVITIRSISLTEADREENIITVNPITSPNAGKMMAMGTPGGEFRVSFFRQRELTQPNSPSTLTFEYDVAGNEEDDQATSERLEQENRDYEFNDQGQFYLWIGGQVDISQASPGSYQGEFTLEIEYI